MNALRHRGKRLFAYPKRDSTGLPAMRRLFPFLGLQLLLLLPCLSASNVWFGSPFERLLNTTGGYEQLEVLLKHVSDYASSLRNGIKNDVDGYYHGYFGLVKRITFDDGVKWAAKISESRALPDVLQGVDAVDAIKQYCPSIPVAKTYGQIESFSNGTVILHLMDWIDGVTIWRDPLLTLIEEYHTDEPGSVYKNLTIPQQLVPQLAEFVYNLTTCPVPRTHSIIAAIPTEICSGRTYQSTPSDGPIPT
jgi:hypothetical protein